MEMDVRLVYFSAISLYKGCLVSVSAMGGRVPGYRPVALNRRGLEGGTKAFLVGLK